MASSNFIPITAAFNWAQRDSGLIYIILFDNNNEVFATYNPDSLKLNFMVLLKGRGVIESGGILHTVVPIQYQNVQFGKLLLRYSLEEVYKEIYSNKITSLYISLTVLILGVVVSLPFSRMITKPIIELRNAAEEVAMGNHDVRIKIHTFDEIGVLGNAFCEMIGKIKNSIKDREEALQKAVSAKEVQEQIGKELAKANSQLKTEITERMRAEEKVRESLARFAGILDTAHEAIISIDETQRIINFNKGAEQIFGYAPDEAVGQSLDTLIPEKFHASHRSYVAEFAGCGKTAYRKGERREIIGCRKDGAEFPAEASISKLEVSGKKILTVVLRDVTERKRAEKEKSKLETRLRQSQKMEAIGTLAGGIAHDFNNILWVILGNAEMGLRKLSEDSVVRDKLQEILTASKRAKELVEQILTFSRQEEQECKPVQIHFIVKEALRLLQASLPSTIEIRQDIRDCGAVLADPSQIHQVIMNLGTNAYQAMGELGGLLEVSMEVVDLDAKSIKSYPELQIGRFVEMTIRDTGCGMDPTTAERIFDPYFTTKGVGEGTGMGLATVHGIVTGLGGAIKVNSEPGKGSTFRVFLPRHDGSISEESEVERETSELRGNEHILVVDDEEQVVTMLGDMLEELGYEVTTETSSVEVLRQFQAHSDRFDLVITDRTMPRMTGLELAEEMVRIRPDIPIILATGFSKIVTEDKIKHSGIRECLKKPIVFHDLEDAIRRALDGKE